MKSMVVLFALCAAACGSLVPLAQPAHYPALVLDAHGRPLDTAEVINSRALHLQAKALEGHYGFAAPAFAHTSPLLAHPAFGYAGYGGHGHYLYKRSLGHYAHSAPAALSHQSRVDVYTSLATVTPIAHIAVGPIAHAAVLPATHHGGLVHINHAAVAPIAHVGSVFCPRILSC